MGRDARRSRVVVIVLLVVAFILITIDYRSSDNSSGLRGIFRAAFGTAEGAVTSVTRPIGRTVSSLTHPNRYQERADALAAENAELKRQIAQNDEARRLSAALSDLRLLADAGQYTILPARVIAIGDVTGTEWTVTINAGDDDGIKPDMLVVNSDGVVGTVLSVTGRTALIRLVCDAASAIGARLEGTQLLGAVTGRGEPNALTFTLYDARHQVRVGDRLVTFGSADYAGGVPIGVITNVLDASAGLSRSAEVTTFAGTGALDLVGVVVGRPASDPGDRVLPPRPVPEPPAQPAQPPVPGQPVQASPTSTATEALNRAPNPATSAPTTPTAAGAPPPAAATAVR